MRKLTALLASLLLILLTQPSAQAGDYDVNPMVQKSTDGGVHTVIVQGPDNMYGLRDTLANFETRTDGINYRYGKGLKCADFPSVTCLRVKIYNWGPGKFPDPVTGPCSEVAQACAQHGGNDPTMWINRHQGTPDRILMCHEWGHTIGLGHHSHRGCDGTHGYKNLSDLELNALSAEYGYLVRTN